MKKDEIATCLRIRLENGDIYKVWLELRIENKKTYCVIRSSENDVINEEIKYIQIDKEMEEYAEWLGWYK